MKPVFTVLLWAIFLSACTVSTPVPETPIDTAAVATVSVKGAPDWLEIGFGFVWVRHGTALLTVIDPKTNKIVKRYGPSQGSGAVRARDGSVWLSAHDVQVAWCLDPGR